MVAQSCNPSHVRFRAKSLNWYSSWSKAGYGWWCTPLNLALCEAEAGGSLWIQACQSCMMRPYQKTNMKTDLVGGWGGLKAGMNKTNFFRGPAR